MSTPNVQALTPSQTVGPFFSDCLLSDGAKCDDLAPDARPEDRISVYGHVYDGAGAPVPDAMLELWQDGSRFGRIGADVDGRFAFSSVLPSVEGSRYISVAVFARGLLNHLYTRIYLPGEPSNDSDSVLLRVPVERRPTLIAHPDGARTYRFDIMLQGTAETVFFDFA